MAGKKVILIDFDFRNPNISRTFNITEETGVSEFLEGEIEAYEIIKRTEQKNLFVAAAGRVPLQRTNELLLSEKVKDFFSYLEDVFDFIIVDTPPLEPTSDAYILSEYCDASLYVIRHRYTPKSIIRLLDQNVGIKTLNDTVIVFNAVKPRGFIKHTYGYGYGFTYAYNDKSKGKRM
jgi:capsular exopolysaccharide synthesis family protein